MTSCLVNNRGTCQLWEHIDADYAKDLSDRKSTTNYIFTFSGGVICWNSMIQSLI